MADSSPLSSPLASSVINAYMDYDDPDEGSDGHIVCDTDAVGDNPPRHFPPSSPAEPNASSITVVPCGPQTPLSSPLPHKSSVHVAALEEVSQNVVQGVADEPSDLPKLDDEPTLPSSNPSAEEARRNAKIPPEVPPDVPSTSESRTPAPTSITTTRSGRRVVQPKRDLPPSDDRPDQSNSRLPGAAARPSAGAARGGGGSISPSVLAAVMRRRKAEAARWKTDFVLSNSRSPLGHFDVRALLCQPEAWEVLDADERYAVLALFPREHQGVILGAGTDDARPDIAALKNDDNFRHDCARYRSNLQDGFFDRAWLESAFEAHEMRREGFFDAFVVKDFESGWGIAVPAQYKPASMRPDTNMADEGENGPGPAPRIELSGEADAEAHTTIRTSVDANIEGQPETKTEVRPYTTKATSSKVNVDQADIKVNAQIEMNNNFETQIPIEMRVQVETQVETEVNTANESKMDSAVESQTETKTEATIETKIETKEQNQGTRSKGNDVGSRSQTQDCSAAVSVTEPVPTGGPDDGEINGKVTDPVKINTVGEDDKTSSYGKAPQARRSLRRLSETPSATSGNGLPQDADRLTFADSNHVDSTGIDNEGGMARTAVEEAPDVECGLDGKPSGDDGDQLAMAPGTNGDGRELEAEQGMDGQGRAASRPKRKAAASVPMRGRRKRAAIAEQER